MEFVYTTITRNITLKPMNSKENRLLAARVLVPTLMLFLLLAVSGCVSSKGASGTVYEVGDVHSVFEFVSYLEDMGYDLERVGILNNAPIPNTQAANVFSIRIKEIPDYVLLFEYHDADRAHHEARRLDVGYLPPPPAGHNRSRRQRQRMDLGTPIPLGRRPPVFQYENFVAIHYGHNAAITTTLARVFGRNVTR